MNNFNIIKHNSFYKKKMTRKRLFYFLPIFLVIFSCSQNDSPSELSSQIDLSKKYFLNDTSNYKSDSLRKGISNVEKALGFIKTIETIDNLTFIKIDYIDWLIWCNDSMAIIKDLIETKKINKLKLSNFDIAVRYCPNGFYIRNRNPRIRKFILDKNVKIVMQNLHGYLKCNEETSLDTFMDVYFNTYLKIVPYHIIVRDSIVTNITEQYVP